MRKAGAVASNIASFLLWYLQGNQAQLASPANVTLIHRQLLEFCQLEGAPVWASDENTQAGVFVAAVRGRPIRVDVFHRPAGNSDPCSFIGSTLQRLDPQLRGSASSAATCILCGAAESQSVFTACPRHPY